jgi:pteridine reductase
VRRTAIVTGAARRIGRATALALAARGFDLALTRHARGAELAATADEARRVARQAGRAITVREDALDLEDAEAVVRYAATFDRPVDVLVHNASRYHACEWGRITAEAARADFAVNALAPLLLTQGLRGALAGSGLPGGGLVVAFGDMHAAGRPLPAYASYMMSKAALHEMVRSLAVALAPAVRVNGILPGVLAWPDDADPGLVERYEARIPLRRAGTPEDAARLVVALALEMPYMTGELLRLDGGRWLT